VRCGSSPRSCSGYDPPICKRNLALAPRILGAILRTRPDAIWYNLNLSSFGSSARAFAGFLLPAITRKLGLRSVVTLHDLPNQSLAELGFADDARTRLGLDWALAALLQSDAVCVTIRRYQDELLGWRRGDRTEIVHVPLGGYGEPSYEPPTPSPTILMLTAHAPHKNLPLLLNAFASVRPAVPRARLLVAGIDHPRFRGYLSAVRQQFAWLDGVEWLGPIAAGAMRALFARSTVVVVPYRVATGASSVIYRAIEVGRPVVVSDLPEFRAKAIEEDVWLEFVPRDDFQFLATTLTRLLLAPQLCQEIAEHNLVAARRYRLPTIAEIYARLFVGTVGDQRSASVSPSPSGALSL
jgi:glycosyltransferase involved in cell wall biosynthesis